MNRPIKIFDRLPQATRIAAPWRRLARSQGRTVPLVGVIRNPRSHGNKGRELEHAADAEVITETTQKRRELVEVLGRLAVAGVDYIAIDGGDGTVRDVLTSGDAIFGDEWPPLIVLPKGKTNALAADLGLPADWTLARAIERARAGSFTVRRPLVVAEAAQPEARVQGFMMGAGVFTKAIGLGQSAHRWGAFNAVAVVVTTAWSLAQALLASGSNGWRQTTGIRLCDRDGQPIAGGEHQRYVLLSSTLERFPMGLKPFAEVRRGLKLAVLDRPRRKSLAYVPLIAIGRHPSNASQLGYHWATPDSYRIELDDRFILDGEAFPPGAYQVSQGPELRFVVP
jgi:hypothetical protein